MTTMTDDTQDIERDDIDELELDHNNSDEPSDKQDDDTQSPNDDHLDFNFDVFDSDSNQPDQELYQEIQELRRQLNQYQQQAPKQQTVLRQKPKLIDFDYDDEAFEADLEAWYQEKATHDELVKQEQAKYQYYDDNYLNTSQALRAKVADYDTAEASVIDHLSTNKQAMIKMMVDDPANMVYLLGKNPAKLSHLAKLDDAKFIKELVLLEQQVVNRNRNPNKPAPKNHELTGMAGGSESVLAKLEAEAIKTGDRSALLAYKRKQKRQS